MKKIHKKKRRKRRPNRDPWNIKRNGIDYTSRPFPIFFGYLPPV